ncbi:hypothetical protein [Picosynechococcus sp. PCC 8807]|uniref:hypothetical protein n=1 Tax=Picosynechococcus sp. PCC 8807 TaxID=195248 RepID=UPI000810B0A9|nr:hypothetical protein [Picosynechococcus sp. PCC 8807]ANV90658.1 hypothetical protein AWQ24_08470 [Picosynechococcus sp. PCC 8807]
MGENFFSVIYYSFYIFEGNYIELIEAFKSYSKLIEENQKNLNRLFEPFGFTHHASRELARLLHNYATAWYSLKENTYAINNKLKKNKELDVRNFEYEYKKKLEESLKDSFENIFIADLRRYVQHKKMPVPTLHFRGNCSQEKTLIAEKPVFDLEFKFEIISDDIRDFDWNSKIKKYLRENQSVPIIEIVEKHFLQMENFYLWIQFRDHQLHPSAQHDIKNATFEEYKKMKLEGKI